MQQALKIEAEKNVYNVLLISPVRIPHGWTKTNILLKHAWMVLESLFTTQISKVCVKTNMYNITSTNSKTDMHLAMNGFLE